MDAADEAWVCYSPSVLEHKRLPPLDGDTVKQAFQREDLHVVQDHSVLPKAVRAGAGEGTVFLLMSSGRFGGMDLVGTIESALHNR
mgnify:FL=1